MNLIKPSFSTGYAKNASESANPNLWKGLVGAWMPSFGVTGNTLKDVSGNGNDGTLIWNGTTGMNPAQSWSGSLKGIVNDFDGINDAIQVDDDDSLSFGNGSSDYPFTISTIVKFTSFNRSFMGLCGKDTGVQREYALLSANRRFRIFIKHQGGGSQQSVDAADYYLQLNRWYHVAATYDGRGGNSAYLGLRIFVDGKESSLFNIQANFYTSMSNTSAPFYIGTYAGNYSNVQIASTKIHNRALSPSEIKQLYLNPSAPFERKQQTVGISTAQAFNPYWGNQATQLAGTLQ